MQQQQMNKMMEFMPLMFLVFSFQVAAGLTLYWVVSNVYSIFQQYIFMGWGTLPVPWNRREPPGPDMKLVPNGKPSSPNGTVGGPGPAFALQRLPAGGERSRPWSGESIEIRARTTDEAIRSA